MVTLNTLIKNIPRITDKYAKKLEKLHIKTVEDFFMHIPFRYEDYSEIIPISEIAAGQTATVIGKITASKTIITWKRKMTITEIMVADESESIRAVWFNQSYLSDSLKVGKEVRLSGKISNGKNGIYFSNPAWEFSQREPTNTGRLVPIYSETEGITSRWMRWQLQNLFKLNLDFIDPIPEKILKELHLPDLKTAIRYSHFPESNEQAEHAQKRFAFQEMLIVQLKSIQVKAKWDQEKSVSIPFNQNLIKKFVDELPFKLTNAQRKASFEILKDLEKSSPMNRLLNGDVGSGKTIVAAIAALQAISKGYQVAIMAPTEVLARQHFFTLSELLKNYEVNTALLTNSYQEIKNSQYQIPNIKSNPNDKISKSKKTLRENLLANIKSGKLNLIIGTHSLIQKDVYFNKLALIIIDEQHRFGVAQRAYLQQQIETSNDGLSGKIPHFLTMSATPIPRTLALAFFGNLDLSILDEMPKNRKQIITQIIIPSQREKIYAFIENEIKNGRQAFVILPLVEESNVLTEVKAAVQEHKRLSEKIFPDLKIGLAHGKLKAKEKEKVMLDFKNRKIDILVATAVVEVGIDIPNATAMIIEDADRFGLSQLHQFRGRVGRGEQQSYCFLFTSKTSGNAKKRLQTLVDSENGFKIAEKDLEIRGPGEFFGTRQSGLPDIAMENLANVKLIQIAREHAKSIIIHDPDLKKHPLLKKALNRFEQNVHLE